jgi:hypothetical protein
MTTYVAFDGDKDIWAYQFMRGWSANKRIDFELVDAHDLDNMTDRARGEYYVKEKLRERMNKSKAFVLLVGESTKHLHKYVGWEIELAVKLGLPIIVLNLNNKAVIDRDLAPPKFVMLALYTSRSSLRRYGTPLIVGQPSSAGLIRRRRLQGRDNIQNSLGRNGSPKEHKANAAPVRMSWIWTLAFGHHEDRTPAHRYAETREAAMVAFAKSWRGGHVRTATRRRARTASRHRAHRTRSPSRRTARACMLD